MTKQVQVKNIDTGGVIIERSIKDEVIKNHSSKADIKMSGYTILKNTETKKVKQPYNSGRSFRDVEITIYYIKKN
jgi:hypothetical protein